MTRWPITWPASRSGIASIPETGEIETASRSEALTVVPTGTKTRDSQQTHWPRRPVRDLAAEAGAHEHDERPPGCQQRTTSAAPLLAASRAPAAQQRGLGERAVVRRALGGALRPGRERSVGAVASGMA